MKMKNLLWPLLILSAALAAMFFFFGGSSEPHFQDLAHHDHDHGEAGDDSKEDGQDPHQGVRRSRTLEDPRHQSPPEEPLVTILTQEKLFAGPFMAARFAADGKHIVMTGESYRGLWVAARDGSGLRQISDGYMAGWRPVTTKDGDLIYRTAEVDEHGNIVSFTIVHHDLETGNEEILYHGVGEDVYPPWLTRDEDMVLVLRDGEVVAKPLGDAASSQPWHERDEGFAFADGGQVFYRHLSMEDPVPLSTDPEATGGEVASPCGRYVAYLSGNTDSALIVNLQTGEEVNIGDGSNLAWSPDGNLLLYDVILDDGHRILNSELFIVQANGENPQRITLDSNRAFHNPSWSPEGDYFVAEDAHTGEIFTFQVTISSNRNDNSK